MDEDRHRTGAHFLTSLLTGFAGFALLLAVLGLYGVTHYAVQQRERELAIRMAVGADRSAVIRLFLKEGARLLGLGLILGLAGTFVAVRILESQVYGVQPFDRSTVLAACALMTAVGLLTIWWPARCGTLRDPLAVLRES